ncbi:hypothetical protein CISG_03431 [Coccidioides immitis RMSCC 3703]|uniref:Uncharacterized protein n=1 Tax=Coccidioides immitis RMSCC 3703 TaxID=454286 RepID=A0A0J8QLA9_COCIT|nr:hypothetical protein CISG_03431 [Coccidioides immitis RMSCC 3703]
MATWKGSTTSPWYTIPAREIVSVEHPCVVKNVDRAIGTLQRGPGIAEILDPTRPHAAATLSLNPDDGMSRPLFSTSKPANNMLLRVSVPKRTGRKRKRGSQDPYVDDARSTSTLSSSDSGSLDAKQLLRRLRDNAGRYDVEIVGRIDRMHVFRGRVLWSADMGVDADVDDPGVPDFVYSTTASPFMTKFRPFLVLSRDAPLMLVPDEKLKEFDLDMSKGATSNVDIVPPPSFSLVEMPFKYTYRQNPSVKQALNPSGETMTINTQQITKVFTHLVPCDVPSVPTESNDKLPPIDTLDAALKKTIGILQKLFDDRPAWTRRGLRNHLTTNDQKYTLRTAVPYTEDDISRVAVDSSEVGGKCVQLASEIRGTLRSAPGRRNANRGEGTRDTEVGKSGRKRVRWEDEEEEEEGEEGEEAEEVRQLEEEEEREDEGEEDDESEAIGE